MKILVSRRDRILTVFIPKKIRVKWHDKAFECQECHCSFKLELGDNRKILARLVEVDGGEVGLNDFLEYIIFCPEGCGAIVQIGESVIPDKDSYNQILWLKRK